MRSEAQRLEQFRADLPKPACKQYRLFRAATVAVARAATVAFALAFDAVFESAFDVDPR
jgi:hypothetical protein